MNKDRYVSKMFLRGDNVILVLKVRKLVQTIERLVRLDIFFGLMDRICMFSLFYMV